MLRRHRQLPPRTGKIYVRRQEQHRLPGRLRTTRKGTDKDAGEDTTKNTEDSKEVVEDDYDEELGIVEEDTDDAEDMHALNDLEKKGLRYAFISIIVSVLLVSLLSRLFLLLI